MLSDHAGRCQTAATGVRNPHFTFGFCRERAESSLKQVVSLKKKKQETSRMQGNIKQVVVEGATRGCGGWAVSWRGKNWVCSQKKCVSVSIFNQSIPKRQHTLCIFRPGFKTEILEQLGGAPQQTEWKKWNRSHGAEGGWKEEQGESLGGQGGTEGRTWFMRPVSGIIERRRDAAEAGGQTERERGRR